MPLEVKLTQTGHINLYSEQTVVHGNIKIHIMKSCLGIIDSMFHILNIWLLVDSGNEVNSSEILFMKSIVMRVPD